MYELYPKTFSQDKETREILLEGTKICSDVVGSTMGPGGRLVMYEESYRSEWPMTTKDGVSVAKMIKFFDQKKDLAAQFVIQAAINQVQETGDGTTLTTILIHKILYECTTLINAGLNANYVCKQVKDYLYKVVDIINSCSTPIKNQEQLSWIATISSNNDKELGKIISEAVWKTGEYGLVTHQRSRDENHHVIYEEGYRLDCGLAAREFANDPKRTTAFYRNPYLIITDMDIFYIRRLIPVINRVLDYHQSTENSEEKPTLILVAPNISAELMNTFVSNASQNDANINLRWVKPTQSLDQEQIDFTLIDIASISGGIYLSKNSGVRPEEIKMEHIGQVDLLSQTPKESLIMGFNSGACELRVEELKDMLNKDVEPITEKYIKESIAKIEGGVATILCGGKNVTEQNEVYDRVDDAKNACKSALQEGFSRGGGVELLDSIKHLQISDEIFRKPIRSILSEPAKRILTNEGREDWQRIIDEIIRGIRKGYRIDNDDDVDMIESNIVDPTKVLTRAIKNAVSSAMSMLKTSTMITHDLEGVRRQKEFENYGKQKEFENYGKQKY